MIAERGFRSWAAWLGLVLILALTACGAGSAGASGMPAASATAKTGATGSGTAGMIVIKNFMFSPANLSVAPGTVVTVRNEDSVAHTLTDKTDPKLFGTGSIGPGQVKTFKAPGKAGSYPYICMIHQYMTGTLVVR